MTPRFVRLCVAVASLALMVETLAQTPPPSTPPPLGNIPGAPQPAPGATAPQAAASPAAGATAPGSATAAPGQNLDELVQLRLPDADLETVLSALEIYTGKIVLRPAQLTTATYNIKIDRPIPKREAILAIETVLALNKIGLAPLGERFLKVVNLQEVKTEAPEMITGTTLDRPASGKAASKIFQLEFLRVGEFLPMIQQSILNPYYGQSVVLQNANAMMITDSVSNLQRVELLLQQLDRPITAGMKPKFFQLKNGAKASDVVNKLRGILQGTLTQQLGQATSYSADDRTNQIVVVTDPRQWDFFAELIDQLDQKSDPNTRNEVIYLKHAEAAKVVTVLTQLITKQSQAISQRGSSVRPGTTTPPTPTVPGTPPTPTPPTVVAGSTAGNVNVDMGANEFSGAMTIVNDERSNAIVVSGTVDDIRLVRDLIDKLDIVLAQVRIEVVIAEVTLSDNDQTGIGALGLKLDGDKLVGFTATGIGGNTNITNGTITRPGTTGHMDLAAEISIGTTPRKSNSTILSHPAIVTSHGKKATIFNGETRPVVSGVLTGAGGVTTGLTQSSNVIQQQIGTTLTVTPFIGSDGAGHQFVNLDIVQSVEDVTGTVTVDNNQQYIIGKRTTESNVSARSGDILVFGGFQKQTDTKGTSRLGPIPILGDIFGSRNKLKSHQELIFFLRPTVLKNEPRLDNAETMERVEKLPTRDQIKQHLDPAYEAPKPSVLDRILRK